MKTCLLILVAVSVTYCLPTDVYKTEWEKFKKQYHKNYSPEEDEFRFKLFHETLDIVIKHNEDYKKGKTTFEMGLNQFADLTWEEKQKLLGTHSTYGENEEVKSTHLPMEVYHEEWEKFKSTYKKLYESPEEEERRFKIFCKNLDKIFHHNELYDKGLVTDKMGVNKFADWTPEEFNKMMGFKPKKENLNQELSNNCGVEWSKFKKQFHRHYSAKEDLFRYKLFCNTVNIITKHNEDYKKGLTTFKMGLNKFADSTPEEFKEELGFKSKKQDLNQEPSDNCEVEWEKFKERFNRHYSAEEEQFRYKLFCNTLDIITKHNEDYEKGLTTYKMGLNKFADLTPEERQKYLGHLLHGENDKADSSYLPKQVYQEEWEKFKSTYKKLYDSPEEEERRFKIFCENLDKIYRHNELYNKGLVTYKLGVNKYADLTLEEFKKKMDLRPVKQSLIQESSDDFETEWEKFKKQFNKHYAPEEESHRFGIFSENLSKIIKHNEDYEKGLTLFKMGITRFTDMTREEYLKFLEEEAGGHTFAPPHH